MADQAMMLKKPKGIEKIQISHSLETKVNMMFPIPTPHREKAVILSTWYIFAKPRKK